MKIKLLIIALASMLSWGEMRASIGATDAAEVAARPAHFDEMDLRRFAEDKGYGYKTGNLRELQKLVDWFNVNQVDIRTLFSVRVPKFVGIPSSKVVKVLRRARFDIASKWGKVVGTLSDREQQEAFESKQIPDTFWRQQRKFVKNLRIAFKRLSETNPFGLARKELQQFKIFFRKAREDRLMVRSTGKEDTRAMANAGGNESIPNVEPTWQTVAQAAEEVVVSYFSEKSLKQRLGLGDKTVFAPDIFCPVLIQRMIGEHEGGEIPACGVMFTEEAEGGISYKEETDATGRIKTTGITMIQAAYGHNEGVVNSKVVVDTYIAQNIDGQPVFYPIIRNKRTRLAPRQAMHPAASALRETPNEARMALKPALSEGALITLKKFADALEDYYGYPMDVEFVVRGKMVWIVQARPIVHKEERKHIHPKYLADLKAFPAESIFKGRTIGAFGGALVEVTSPDECIVSDRIGMALDEYLKGNRNRIKCVFSGTDAPATSHEATTFRGEGKPVLYVPNIAGVRDALAAGKRLIFSPQQHAVVAEASDVALDIKDGWIAYPLPRELSFVPLLVAGEKRLPSQLLLTGKAKMRQPKRVRGALEIKPLFDALKHEDPTIVQAAAQKLPDVMAELFFRRQRKHTKVSTTLKRQLQIIVRSAMILCRRLVALCVANASHLERLLVVNYLEALVYQQQFAARELRYLSVAVLNKMLKEEGGGVTVQPHFSSPQAELLHTQLKKVSQVTFESTTEHVWGLLINGLAHLKNPQALQGLGWFVAQLQSFDVLPLWLHSTMVNDVITLGWPPKPADLARLVLRWLASYRASKDSFATIKALSERVAAFNVGRFADPKSFEDAWHELLTLRDDFVQPAFTGIVSESSEKLPAAAATALMAKFVDLFDISIKAMKGSALWKQEDKPATFQTMLQHYFTLLNRWTMVIPGEHGEKLEANNSIIGQYLGMMQALVNKEAFTIDDLDPSIDFDASPFAMGSGHDWVQDKEYNQQPSTGEDVYTIIHQSLINVVSLFSLISGVELVQQPPLMQEIARTLDAAFEPTGRIRPKKLVGLTVDASGMTVFYNIPLGSHSLQITLQQGPKGKDIQVQFNFFGGYPHEAYRWINLASLLALYNASSKLSTSIHKVHAHALSFDILVNETNKAEFYMALESMPEVVETGAKEELGENATDKIGTVFDSEKIKASARMLEQSGSLGFDAQKVFFIELIKKGNVVKGAGDMAREAVMSTRLVTKVTGLKLFKTLVEQRQEYAAAAAAAGEAVKNGDIVNIREQERRREDYTQDEDKGGWDSDGWDSYDGYTRKPKRGDIDIREEGLKLFKALFEQGQGYAEAAAAADKAVKNKNPLVQSTGFQLFRMLVEQEQRYAEATEAANSAVEALESKDYNVQKDIINLFKALLNMGRAVEKAAEAAGKAIKSKDGFVQDIGFSLFKIMFEKGHGHAEAAATAEEMVRNKDPEAQWPGLDLFKLLIERGLALDKAPIAVEAAGKAIMARFDFIQEAGLNLFTVLFKQGLGYAEALVVASKAMEDLSPFVKQSGMNLFEALVEREQGYDEVATAASKAMEDLSPFVQKLGSALFNVLMEKGQGYTQAATAAGKAVRSWYHDRRISGLLLFRELLKYEAAKEAVMREAATLRAIPEEERRGEVTGVLELLERHVLGR